MSTFEQPINEADIDGAEFKQRKEEEFMYKYMSMKPKQTKGSDDLKEHHEGTDSELDAFADAEMEAERKRM